MQLADLIQRTKSVLKSIQLDTLCRILSSIIKNADVSEKDEKLKQLDELRDKNELIQAYLSFIPDEHLIDVTCKLIKMLKVDSNTKSNAVQLEEVLCPYDRQSSELATNNQSDLQRYGWNWI